MADAAHEVAAALIVEDAEAPVQGEQPETPAVEEEVQPMPAFVADTTGIEDLLGEDEVPDEDSYTLSTDPAAAQHIEFNDYDDAETQDLKKRLAAAERQIEHEKTLRAQNESKRWAEEAARRFPLADVDVIKAQSRRSFLREAQASHQRYEQKLGPTLEELDRYKATLVEDAKAEGRQQAEQAWGKPMSGPQVPTVTASETQVKLDRKQFKSPLDMIRARFEHDPDFQGGI